MALIVCPECNQQVSSAAASCPHCGFPIANHLKQKEQSDYHQKLLSQVAMFQLSSKEPRVKVCARCAREYYYNEAQPSKNGKPMCNCNAPYVEIDLPQSESSGVLEKEADHFEQLIFPRNIGDKLSQEYKAHLNDLYGQLNRSRSLRNLPPREPPAPIKDLVDRSTWKPIPTATPKPAASIPACPYCRSTSLTKISKTGSFLKVYAFGIFGAGDIGKTWKCNNCGSKF